MNIQKQKNKKTKKKKQKKKKNESTNRKPFPGFKDHDNELIKKLILAQYLYKLYKSDGIYSKIWSE